MKQVVLVLQGLNDPSKILHSESKQSDMTTLWPNDM